MENKQEFIKIDPKGKKARARLFIVEFEDNGHVVAFNQSLNLSGYGTNSKEAKEMLLGEVLKDFFENLFEHSEAKIFEVFKNLGWKRSMIFNKELSKSAHVDREGILRNFNLSEETEIHGQLVSV